MSGRPVPSQLDQVLPRFYVQKAGPYHPFGRIRIAPFGKGGLRIFAESGYSEDIHPLHLHRHSFELTRIGGKTTAGVIKDVVMMGGFRGSGIQLRRRQPRPDALPLSPAVAHGFRVHGAVQLCIGAPGHMNDEIAQRDRITAASAGAKQAQAGSALPTRC